LEDIISLLSTYGYIILFFYSFGGGFVGLAVAGFLSSTGKMDITTSILVATIANFIGDLFLFYITKYQKHEFKAYLKNHRRKLAYAHIFMKKYGNSAIFIQKYIYGVKTFIPIAIALTKYDSKKFVIYNLFASIVWGLIVGITAYMMGEVFVNLIEEFSGFSYILIGILIAISIYFFYNSKKDK
jgi:membrane protein DedA with SNARE-associated domain